MSRVFANGPEDRGSIPGGVVTMIQKWYLMLHCLTLSIIRYLSRVKWNNPGNRFQFHSTTKKKTYMPNNRISENS